jgi:hypothetical protein
LNIELTLRLRRMASSPWLMKQGYYAWFRRRPPEFFLDKYQVSGQKLSLPGTAAMERKYIRGKTGRTSNSGRAEGSRFHVSCNESSLPPFTKVLLVCHQETEKKQRSNNGDIGVAEKASTPPTGHTIAPMRCAFVVSHLPCGHRTTLKVWN